VKTGTYRLLQSGLVVRRALLARRAHKSHVGEKKFATDSEFAKKRDGRLGGAHGPARRSLASGL